MNDASTRTGETVEDALYRLLAWPTRRVRRDAAILQADRDLWEKRCKDAEDEVEFEHSQANREREEREAAERERDDHDSARCAAMTVAREYLDRAVAAEEREKQLRRMIYEHHQGLAAIGGGPCICEVCESVRALGSAAAADTPGTRYVLWVIPDRGGGWSIRDKTYTREAAEHARERLYNELGDVSVRVLMDGESPWEGYKDVAQRAAADTPEHKVEKVWHGGGSVVGAVCTCGLEGTIQEIEAHVRAAADTTENTDEEWHFPQRITNEEPYA